MTVLTALSMLQEISGFPGSKDSHEWERGKQLSTLAPGLSWALAPIRQFSTQRLKRHFTNRETTCHGDGWTEGELDGWEHSVALSFLSWAVNSPGALSTLSCAVVSRIEPAQDKCKANA